MLKHNQYTMRCNSSRYSIQHRQKGVSIFIVLVMLILGLVSVLSAVRIGILNEAFVGNDADAQRTFAAAEAMMRDAMIDVNGVKDDGSDCNAAANSVGCRLKTQPHLLNQGDGEVLLVSIRDSLLGATCAQGVCVPTTGLLADFWSDKTALAAMKPLAAKYGQFTGASAAGNPILASKGWYWIEEYEYAPSLLATNRLPIPDQNFPFVIRVTVLAEGNKPGSRTILQSYVVPRPQLS